MAKTRRPDPTHARKEVTLKELRALKRRVQALELFRTRLEGFIKFFSK